MKIDSKWIAKLSGVSRSTVSRVINDYPDISPATKEKVWKVIKENGYYPNISAQKLAGKKTNIIGLLVYTGKSSTDKNKRKRISESLYYSELISEIIDEAENLGYVVLVSYLSPESSDWRKIFQNELIEGAIVLAGGKKIGQISELILSSYKILLLDYEKMISNERVGTMKANHVLGGYKATEYLIQRGHHRILHITGEIKRKISIQRARGYLECLGHYGIETHEILYSQFDQEKAYCTLRNYIKEKKGFYFTAIFAGNDYIALGVMKALQEHHLKVPEDVSIIAYDNMDLCKYTTPKITSVDHLGENIAKKALLSLIDIIHGKKGGEEETEILIRERESVATRK
ncbi:LacI family transcriptional regulator [Fusobacterium necrophorum]|uniref:Transcriptional regulator n=2 Tax=Fusobacterium necrophorum TaxID=859 RepID=A0AB73BZH5_9FUSO|nr:LacI family DNA-binding transcriptional regulator [Fusobacterium necrophorum]AYZ74140.1 LacI family transcriptional regulator [Fusobacterium necrophorum]AZW09980.1 LacI family transcriptional regulator [Fusobacterium necrophorum subsp. necrophorum]KDE63821.1 transcriptional regulator [Fusobacterium necrophorum BFTR-1]KDE64594.1 transcriptional regulator [Fusobacterium necrophorum DJ-1]KDE65563.1 transcriptional regulator [Fusobacterium necrophorum BL]